MNHKAKYTLTLLLSIAVLGCGEDDECQTADALVSDTEDLIAFLDPNRTEFETGTLYVMQEWLPAVLEELGAVETDPGRYEMNVELLDGTMEAFFFATEFTDRPYLFETNSSPEEVKSKYKVYRDAECEELDGPTVSDCTEADDGTFYKIEWLGWDRCKKGSGICTEIEKVIYIKRLYEDSGCTILTDVETSKYYDCN